MNLIERTSLFERYPFPPFFLTFTDMSMTYATSQRATGMCPLLTAQFASAGCRQIVSAMIGSRGVLDRSRATLNPFTGVGVVWIRVSLPSAYATPCSGLTVSMC
jgi:hypothetical protein